MLKNIDENKLKFHKIEGTNKEWVEFAEESFLLDNEDGNFTLVVCNLLKDQPQLTSEIVKLYSPDVFVDEYWVRVEVLRDAEGRIRRSKKISNTKAPIIKDGFAHALTFTGDNKNYLKFIEWDISKKLEDRNKLKNIDIKEEKKEVDIPEFLKKENKAPEEKTNETLKSEINKKPEAKRKPRHYREIDATGLSALQFIEEFDRITQEMLRDFRDF